MRVVIRPDSVLLWVSARETESWARRPGAAWPCSALSGKRLFAAFDTNGLFDVAVNGRYDARDCLSDEFNALTSDFLSLKLPPDHPCYFVTVGQFSTGRGEE